MQDFNRKVVTEEETKRVADYRQKRVVDAARAVLQTDEGRTFMAWLLYEACGLMTLGNEGRREAGMAVYAKLDAAQMGAAEKLALEYRQRLSEDNLNIADAIRKRVGE